MMAMKDTDPGFIKFVKRIALLLFPWMVLISCAHAPVVLLHGCQIPEQLDYEAQGPTALETDHPLPPKEAVQLWRADRHLGASIAHDYNDLRSHVKKDCQ